MIYCIVKALLAVKYGAFFPRLVFYQSVPLSIWDLRERVSKYLCFYDLLITSKR